MGFVEAHAQTCRPVRTREHRLGPTRVHPDAHVFVHAEGNGEVDRRRFSQPLPTTPRPSAVASIRRTS